MGAYLGLFNCSICLPQIVAAACGGTVFGLIGGTQSSMMFVSAVLLIAGSACVFLIDSSKNN
jgi:maltose/moltooligosaccharide transporter